MDALHRAVLRIVTVIDEHEVGAIALLLELLGHARAARDPFPLEGMAAEEEQEEHDGEREPVAQLVGGAARHDLRGHVARLPEDAGRLALGAHVVVVADEDVARVRVDEEVAVVEVLVAEAAEVQHPEPLADLHRRGQHRPERPEPDLREEEVPEFIVALGAQAHDVAAAALLILHGEVLRPEERVRGRPVEDVVLEVPAERLGEGLQVPLERHPLPVHLHKVDDALSPAAEYLNYCRASPVSEVNFLVCPEFHSPFF